MKIERKDAPPLPASAGKPKGRVIKGLPKSRKPMEALRSLIPDFPQCIEPPEFLWGRSTTRRVPPIRMRLYFARDTEKAWRVMRELFAVEDPNTPIGHRLTDGHWIPKSQVCVFDDENALLVDLDGYGPTRQYDVWMPYWLAREHGWTTMPPGQPVQAIRTVVEVLQDEQRTGEIQSCEGCVFSQSSFRGPGFITCNRTRETRHDQACHHYTNDQDALRRHIGERAAANTRQPRPLFSYRMRPRRRY